MKKLLITGLTLYIIAVIHHEGVFADKSFTVNNELTPNETQAKYVFNACTLKDVYCEGEEIKELKIETEASTPIEVLIKNTFGDNWKIAYAIMMAESRGKSVSSPYNTNGTRDHGIFQVNDIHGYSVKTLLNVKENIKIAKSIYDDRAKWDTNGWKAWSAYNNGKYLEHI